MLALSTVYDYTEGMTTTMTLHAFTNMGKVNMSTTDFSLFMRRLDALHRLNSAVEVRRVDG